jgi:single-strand DNA-binding protein
LPQRFPGHEPRHEDWPGERVQVPSPPGSAPPVRIHPSRQENTVTDSIVLTGIVATTPRHLVTSSGLAITSFRLACRQRRFDKARNAWVDADTNWYTVSSFRQLAQNVVRSIQKGEHVVVTGRLRIRDWENQDRQGTSVEVEADAVGHNLAWGTTVFVRGSAPSGAEQNDLERHDAAPAAGGESVPLATPGPSAASIPAVTAGEPEARSA